VDELGRALYAAKIISYTQGYQLMRAASQAFGWELNYGGIALMWRGGCIIRSVFLGKDQASLRCGSGAGQPAARSVLPRHLGRGPAILEECAG
jgi:6-phosphogluconate dehydrogenase